MQKLKVGIYGITGCMGCQLNILYQKDLLNILELIDLKSFPVGKENNPEKGNFDIIFLEGVIVSESDLEEVKHFRSITKKLIAIGSCATDGCVPAIKNFINNKKIPQSPPSKQKNNCQCTDKHKHTLPPSPIDKYVTVDATSEVARWINGNSYNS